jgi:hypothetical protein
LFMQYENSSTFEIDILTIFLSPSGLNFKPIMEKKLTMASLRQCTLPPQLH